VFLHGPAPVKEENGLSESKTWTDGILREIKEAGIGEDWCIWQFRGLMLDSGVLWRGKLWVFQGVKEPG